MGPTSFDVVRAFKGAFVRYRLKKVGHFGSLDPFAEGVVLVGFNGAMKFNRTLQERFSKTYVAEGIFGLATPTGDTDCPEEQRLSVDTGRLATMEAAQVESLFREGFLGTYLQAPHRYSAAKHRGRPLYHYARKGTPVDKPPVERSVKSLSVLRWDFPRLVFRAEVGSGTYIRGLFEDFARSLDTRGALSRLVRTAVGPLRLEDAVPMDGLDPSRLADYSRSPEELFACGLSSEKVLQVRERLTKRENPWP